MESSIFAFATDLADEGLDVVLDNVQHRAGAGGITLAASYHEGRDVFPHNPVRKVRTLESGAVFFEPDPARWRDVRLRPPVSECADVLPQLVEAARGRGLAVRAWTIFLHNGALAEAHPDCAPENAFGDRYLTDLCPAHPDVRAFARALAADVAARGVPTICAESVHFHGFEHGYAHERDFLSLGARERFLLGLCFCRHCLAVASDGDAARRFVRGELERAFAGEPSTREGLEELDAYLHTREATVASLVAEVAAAARSGGAKLEVIAPPPPVAQELGIDLDAVARASDGVEAMGYAPDLERVRADLAAYGDAAASMVLRPMPPDCNSADNLREKVAVARERGLGRVDFYHYGFMRLEALDWIRAALT